MIPEFHFSNFNPDDETRFEAGRILDQVLELAPDGTIAVALLAEQEDQFRCSIDLYSKFGPFIAHTVQPTPLLALHHISNVLTEKLRHWREANSTEALSDRRDSARPLKWGATA